MNDKQAKGTFRKLATGLAMGVAGAGLGYLFAKGAAALLGPQLSLKALSAWDLAALPVLGLLVIAVHEAGHLAGGLSRGMSVLIYIVGPFGWVRTAEGLRFRWYFNLGTLGGLAAALPAPDRPLKPQLLPLIAGGPLASALLAAVAAWVAFHGEGRLAAYALVTSGLSAAIFLVTALPLRAGGFLSDGMQLLLLRKDPVAMERRTVLMALFARSLAGTRPRDLDRDTLDRALALAGQEVLYDVGVWLYAYHRAMDEGRTDEAAQWLERMEPVFDQYADGFRQGVAVELAAFEALHRGRLERAKEWLRRSRGGIVEASRRAYAEAAVAAAEGRRDVAHTLLDRASRDLGKGMDRGIAVLGADQIEALRRRMDAPAVAA